MQRCLQQLCFISAPHDFELHARHIPGDHNLFSDALSRWHIFSYQAKLLELSTLRIRASKTLQFQQRSL